MSVAACVPISSGSAFLRSTLDYLDCAGQQLGASGYQALAAPGSVIGQLILTTLTLFIAWHGFRMMFGRMPDMGTAVLAVAKIGLVLMLVSSWPAVRTLFYDTSFSGPSELQRPLNGTASLRIEDRLQRVDDGIVALTSWGTGKLDIRAGRTAEGQPAASSFSGIAMADNLALGAARLAYLVGILMTFGLLSLLAGVLIAALPLFAGFLLFDTGRSLFMGWLRMVFAVFVASFSIPLILTAELSLLEPWLSRVIAERGAFFATPSAPTELLAITGSFFLILLGSTALLIRLCFLADAPVFREWLRLWRAGSQGQPAGPEFERVRTATREIDAIPSRAESIAQTLQINSQRGALPTEAGAMSGGFAGAANSRGSTSWAASPEPQTNQRRASLRVTRSSIKRDNQ